MLIMNGTPGVAVSQFMEVLAGWWRGEAAHPEHRSVVMRRRASVPPGDARCDETPHTGFRYSRLLPERTNPVNRDTIVDLDRHPDAAGPASGPARRRGAATAATAAGVVGGLALFADLALHAFGPLGRSYYLVATVMALCLLGVPGAFWLQAAVTTGWRRGLAVAGTGLVVLGAAAWITAFAVLFTDPRAAFTQQLTPAGSVLMALGMLLLGVAVLASRRLPRSRALAPLVVGVYFPAQLVVQLTFFLGGRDADPGPNGSLLGTWGLLWAWAAWAATSAGGREEGRP